MTLRLTTDDVRGVVGLMPTPATPEANDPAARDTVDIEETTRAVRALEAAGVDSLMLTGTSGEAFALTPDEWRTFIRTAAEAADEMALLAGPTTLNTRDTIDRARFARDVGCEGLLLGRPMWNALTPDATVGFYREVADAVPELGIMVYDNPGAFKGPVTAWGRLAEIENVVAVKYISVGPAYWEARRQVEAADGDLVLVPMDAYLAAMMTWDPELPAVCWSSSVSCGPAPTLALVDALEAGDWARAVELTRRMAWSFETFFPGGDMETFGRHTVSIVKARMAAAGFLEPGPVRPPDPHTPEAYLEGGREAGRRWRELVEEYGD
ncbi:MAG: dihydrodipicolinate synthase family protein [Halobacteriales archaeon]|nr:dihydrodipicolinate synthase family protein [Halobacteriales archaeon]